MTRLPSISLLGITFALSTASEASLNRPAADINAIISSVKTYRINCGELPPSELGLGALVIRPSSLAGRRWVQMADKIPTDPWNRPYRYVAGDGYPGGFGIYSCGKDGLTFTQGNDPDDWNSWSDPDERRDTPARRRVKLSLAGGALAMLFFYLGARVAGKKRRAPEARA